VPVHAKKKGPPKNSKMEKEGVQGKWGPLRINGDSWGKRPYKIKNEP